jgi:hypothetical protein
MNKDEVIRGLIKIYNRFEDEVEADLFLHEQRVEQSQVVALKNEAREAAYQERLKTMPAIQKRRFVIMLVLTGALFVLFFFVLPSMVLFRYKLWLSIIGAVLISGFAFVTWGLYKTWLPEQIKEGWRFRLTGLFFIVLIIPSAIIAGINWFVFDAAQSRRLREHHALADAVVVYGQSVSTRRADFTSVTVQFRTPEGELITASESVPKSRFDDYYKGQRLQIAYLPEDPTIISLLQYDGEVRGVMGTEERRLRLSDLILFCTTPVDSLEASLKKISYAWRYDESVQKFVHEKNYEAVNALNGEVMYLCRQSPQVFKNELSSMGFQLLEEEKVGGIVLSNAVYESTDYRLSVEGKAMKGEPAYLYLLTSLNQ